MSEPTPVGVVVVGAGLSGIAAAIRLRTAGIEDIVVLDRSHDVGGVWRDNTYPGCACDVPSMLYSYSFAPNPDWTHLFAPQREILDYVRRTAHEFGVAPHLRLGVTVLRSDWDGEAQRWCVVTDAGSYLAQTLIIATGNFHEPKVPAIPGLDDFEGEVFHAARWGDRDLRDRRVAVLGTGASAVQIVPAIASRVAQLDLYVRSPPWVLPRPDVAMPRSVTRLFRRVPATQRLARRAIAAGFELGGLGARHPTLLKLAQPVASAYLRAKVRDPQVRTRLTPPYTFGCKRILLSSDFYRAVTGPTVEVVPGSVREVTAAGVVGADGVERKTETIVLATGFHVTDPPVASVIHGASGRSLADTWRGSPRAYLGTTVHGFPNMFLLLGPNGNAETSAITLVETQLAYVVAAVRMLRETGCASIDVRPEVQAAFVDEVDRALSTTVWNTGGCTSYFLDETGRNSVLWPWSMARLTRAMRHFDHDDYTVSTGGSGGR